MAETSIFASHAQIVRKAGSNANATATASEAMINQFATEAESTINTLSQFNWSDAYAGLNVDTKAILMMAETTFGGNGLIAYDMGGYTSRYEAETMLDVNKDNFNVALSLLKDIKKRDFINGA